MDFDLKNTWVTLLDLDWFYDILGVDLKNTWIMNLDWFYYTLDIDRLNLLTKQGCC